MKKDIRITIRIDKVQETFVTEQARVHDISVGQYIRKLIKAKQDASKN